MTGPRDRIDPELREALDAVPKGPNGVFDLTDIPATRKAVRAFAGQAASRMPVQPNVETEELRTDIEGAIPVIVRLHRPTDHPCPYPVLIWFHGGGQVLGYAEQDDPKLKQLAASVGCAVAAVEYRLAPEHPSPAGAEDGVTAHRWLRANTEGLGLDPARIGISGASGGGCIAAAVTLMIRDRDLPAPLFQGLPYPMLDDRNETGSSREITDIGIWDRKTNELAWQAILGGQAHGPDVSSYSAPAREQDLSRLPPMFLAVGELDVFRDEGLDYALRARSGHLDGAAPLPGCLSRVRPFRRRIAARGCAHRCLGSVPQAPVLSQMIEASGAESTPSTIVSSLILRAGKENRLDALYADACAAAEAYPGYRSLLMLDGKNGHAT